MKKVLIILTLIIASVCIAADTDKTKIADVEDSGLAEKYKQTEGEHIKWYKEAGLGLFLHWGISAADPTGNREISWSMIKDWPPGNSQADGEMTPNEYFALAEKFNPQKYNPDKWMKAAADAGFKYAVLTVKHHDGFALWPSDYGNFSTKQYLDGKDLVKPYVQACRKHGLKVGLYFSPPDWYFNREYMSFRLGTEGFDLWPKTQPNEPPLGLDHEEIEVKPMTEKQINKFKKFMKGQVTELLTNYGRIDLLWFDYNFGGECGISMEEIRELQPGIVVNHRLHGHGDFLTYELTLPSKEPPSDVWETCTTMGQGWAYRKDETHKSPGYFLKWLVKARSMGGNFLPNIGPRPDGTLPDEAYKLLEKVSEWMEHSSESVFDIKGDGPYWDDICNYPITMSKDKNIWYIHFLPDTNDPAVVKTDREPEKLTLLRTGDEIKHSRAPEGILIKLNKDLRTSLVDTVKISF